MRYEITEKGGKRKTSLTKVSTTFFEFVEGSNKKGNKHGSSDHRGRDSFYGDIGSFKEMYDACYSGLNVEKMQGQRASLNALVNHEVDTPRKAVVGETLNVGAYCSGSPFHFYKDSDEYGKPRVHLTYSTNAVAGVDADEFIRHGATICSLVDQIADQVDVKITLYISNVYVLSGNGLQVVTIKDYDEEVDVARVGATAHPSFFRRIGFSWFENASRLIDKRCMRGCGGSQTGIHRKNVITEDEFREWLNVADDEMLIDFPAPDECQFNNDADTKHWFKCRLKDIEKGIEEGETDLKLWGR